jgi:hypothetical protein
VSTISLRGYQIGTGEDEAQYEDGQAPQTPVQQTYNVRIACPACTVLDTWQHAQRSFSQFEHSIRPAFANLQHPNYWNVTPEPGMEHRSTSEWPAVAATPTQKRCDSSVLAACCHGNT